MCDGLIRPTCYKWIDTLCPGSLCLIVGRLEHQQSVFLGISALCVLGLFFLLCNQGGVWAAYCGKSLLLFTPCEKAASLCVCVCKLKVHEAIIKGSFQFITNLVLFIIFDHHFFKYQRNSSSLGNTLFTRLVLIFSIAVILDSGNITTEKSEGQQSWAERKWIRPMKKWSPKLCVVNIHHRLQMDLCGKDLTYRTCNSCHTHIFPLQ